MTLMRHRNFMRLSSLFQSGCIALRVDFNSDVTRTVSVSGESCDRFVSGEDGVLNLIVKLQVNEIFAGLESPGT